MNAFAVLFGLLAISARSALATDCDAVSATFSECVGASTNKAREALRTAADADKQNLVCFHLAEISTCIALWNPCVQEKSLNSIRLRLLEQRAKELDAASDAVSADSCQALAFARDPTLEVEEPLSGGGEVEREERNVDLNCATATKIFEKCTSDTTAALGKAMATASPSAYPSIVCADLNANAGCVDILFPCHSKDVLDTFRKDIVNQQADEFVDKLGADKVRVDACPLVNQINGLEPEEPFRPKRETGEESSEICDQTEAVRENNAFNECTESATTRALDHTTTRISDLTARGFVDIQRNPDFLKAEVAPIFCHALADIGDNCVPLEKNCLNADQLEELRFKHLAEYNRFFTSQFVGLDLTGCLGTPVPIGA